MAISNASSGFRPGVCTSSTRPEAPFNGQVIYETDTKRTLVWEGSAWVMLTDADQPPGLQLVKTQTVGTAVSSVTVTDAFSADYDNYRILMSGGVASMTVDLVVTFGGVTTGYYLTSLYNQFNSGTPQGLNLANQANMRYLGYATANSMHMDMTVQSPFLTQPTIVHADTVSATTNGLSMTTRGFLNTTASYSSITIATAVGTMTGGTITVYGYRKA